MQKACIWLLFCCLWQSYALDLLIQVDGQIPPSILQRWRNYLTPLSDQITFLNATEPIPSSLTSNQLLISIGNTTGTDEFISVTELENLGSEGFIVRSASLGSGVWLGTNGNPLSPNVFGIDSNNGLLFGAYRVLQLLGFGFLHLLKPKIPSKINEIAPNINIMENPQWAVRGFHIHSMHPLELTELLNGFASNLSTNYEEWEAMVPEFENFLEWSVANLQNRVEWVLLWTKDWTEFANSPERQKRMYILTNLCHTYGHGAGADVPIAEQQQHTWYMTTADGTLQQQFENIHNRLDWLYSAGFDFLSTENGYSEFTHPNDILMLTWINETANYTANNYPNKRTYIKVHCSSGQTCPNYIDPWTHQPLNFNFLPYYAEQSMGIYPHTVQIYTFDDLAPTYGNTNFEYMFQFMMNETSKREVIFHGETAYWVNYDIDLPLFLPIYGYNRLYDFRKILEKEAELSVKISGTIDFDSGWEWSYWLNDVITANAAWNAHLELDIDSAFLKIVEPVFLHFGPAKDQVSNWILALIHAQKDMLVNGKINGTTPSDIIKRNGMAYLEGWDTFSDIPCTFSPSACTQPVRLGLEELREPFHTPNYETDIRPLLVEMDQQFSQFVSQVQNISSQIPADALYLWQDLFDSVSVLSLRSTQILHLYEYVRNWWDGAASQLQADDWSLAVQSTLAAQKVIQNREANYAVPIERIAGWRTNPTAYSYGYLWTVHSMFYWVRDMHKARLDSFEAFGPCFMNIINPVDVAFGEGIFLNTTEVIRKVVDELGFGEFLADCLAAPAHEPQIAIPT